MTLRFVVVGDPVGQPRVTPRAIRRKGGGLVFGPTGAPILAKFVPVRHPVNAYRAKVADAAARAIAKAGGGEDVPFPSGAIRIKITAVFPRPSSMIWKTKPMPRRWKDGKPDFDNLEKATCDALSGIAWRDDAQISHAETIRLVADGEEYPHVVVEVSSLADVPVPSE